MASQITRVAIICSTVCSGADQRKHQSHLKAIWDPFYEDGLILIPAWISNYIHYKM